jgi:hypothetical protein
MGIAYNTSIVRDGLVLHLDAANPKSYPGSGNTWFDLSKTKTIATVAGATYNQTYFSLDGTDDYFYLGPELVYGSSNQISEMSVFSWIRTTFNSGTPGLWNNQNWAILDFDRSEGYTFALNGTGEIQMSGDAVNRGGIGERFFDILGNTRYNDGLWHFVGWTYSVDNQEIVMYGDGEIDKIFTANGSLGLLGNGPDRYGLIGDGSESTSSSPGGGNNKYFAGDIASVLFYGSKALTQLEVKQNFEALRRRYGI